MLGLLPFRRTDIHSRFETIFEELMDDILNNFDKDFTTRNSTGYPKLDVQELPDKFIIDATIPGLTSADITVEVLQENGVPYLSIRADKQTVSGTKNLVRKEIHRSSFCRNISLPDNIDESSISAAVKNGILTVEIKKKTEEKSPPKKRTVVVQ